ncbi:MULTISPECIES: hypothetical protein [Moorena]|nr:MULTISPECIES: hypothetical protein [Moorena]NEQ14354.1 hypothetical protein [Moorena sp. SIO3E2]NEP31455.1 hypothetical protein [Moorena sp. SIO3B2]NEP65230.1 hypothetical protein [Moorena sp. SIO3A5]NEQ04611.1 hypothetical protein [Moorena sp. SIO4E2]NER87231.1 hypothetical protein [Moorena sp. SIO3A2]
MFKKVFQAFTITILLNLLVYISPPDPQQSDAVPPSRSTPKVFLSLR